MKLFKTIEECEVRLVAYTFGVGTDEHGDYLDTVNYFPCSAARVSFGKEDKTGRNVEADRKLMKYLADHEHLSPFEHQSATFLIECPLFVRSQIHRHRTFSYNEISRRYTEEKIEFWKPTTWRKQSESNRQASGGVLEGPHWTSVRYEDTVAAAYRDYMEVLSDGLCREQARAILPQATLTKFFMTGNLRNWAHFLRLRLDSHTQYETQVIARKIEDLLRALWPDAVNALLPPTDKESINAS